MIEATRKDIIARGVFQEPPSAPRALFRIFRASFRHFLEDVKILNE